MVIDSVSTGNWKLESEQATILELEIVDLVWEGTTSGPLVSAESGFVTKLRLVALAFHYRAIPAIPAFAELAEAHPPPPITRRSFLSGKIQWVWFITHR